MTSTRVCTVRAVGPCGHQTRTPAREHGRACRVRPQESRPTRQSRLSSRWGRQSDPHPPCLPPGQEPTGAAPEGAALSKQPNTPEGPAEALRAVLGVGSLRRVRPGYAEVLPQRRFWGSCFPAAL